MLAENGDPVKAALVRFAAYALWEGAKALALWAWRRKHPVETIATPVAQPEEALLKSEEVCRRLAISPHTLRDWTRAGKVPSIKLGHRSVRYRWSEVKKALGL